MSKMNANNSADPRLSAANLVQLLGFVGGCCTRPGGDQRGSENHTDESESDQNVMHPGFSLWFVRACPQMNLHPKLKLFTSHEHRKWQETGGRDIPTDVGLLVEYPCQNGTESVIYDLGHVIASWVRTEI
jgi:hypothetical protein